MSSIEYEDRVQQALIDLSNDSEMRIIDAARAHQVNPSTLSKRKGGRKSRANSRHINAKLSLHQEKVLANVIKKQQVLYQPVNYVALRSLANKFAIANDSCAEPIGINWPSNFIKRHPDIKSRNEQLLEIERVSTSHPTIILSWLEAAKAAITLRSIEEQDLWNMDEIGARLNHQQSDPVLFNRRIGEPITATSSSTDWTTSIECVSAKGQVIMPLVIHKGDVPQAPLDHWFPPTDKLPNWTWGFSHKGWTTNELALRWFEEIFIPQTHRAGKNRGLVIDMHDSHIQGEMQLMADEYNIAMLWLPAHATHILQPLDQQPFASLKAAYSSRLHQHDPFGQKKVSRAQFDIMWAEARGLALTEKTIRQGWARTGLVPFNPQQPLSRTEVLYQRAQTPDLQPTATLEHRTPKTKNDWLPMFRELRSVLPESHLPMLARIEFHLDELESQLIVYKATDQDRRDQLRDHEDDQVTKRVQKMQEKITTDLADVMRFRGADEPQIDLAKDTVPATFTVMTDKKRTRRSRQRRSKKKPETELVITE